MCVTDGLEITVSIDGSTAAQMWVPVHLMLNKYGQAWLNGWDGNSIEIDEDGNYILAPQIGAGKKNSDNTYTGIVMGEIKNSEKTEVGLFGLNAGQQTFNLDAETGIVKIGIAGNG